jgi:hypothetical protein
MLIGVLFNGLQLRRCMRTGRISSRVPSDFRGVRRRLSPIRNKRPTQLRLEREVQHDRNDEGAGFLQAELHAPGNVTFRRSSRIRFCARRLRDLRQRRRLLFCRSRWNMDGQGPLILGHEFSGDVAGGSLASRWACSGGRSRSGKPRAKLHRLSPVQQNESDLCQNTR